MYDYTAGFGGILMNNNKDEVPYDSAQYMNGGLCGDTPFTGIDEPCLDSEESYVARKGFEVRKGIPPSGTKFPFFTVSDSKLAINIGDNLKEVFSGVQLHLSIEDSHYAEVDIAKPETTLDAVIRLAQDLEFTPYSLKHTGPIPVYTLCTKGTDMKPIEAGLAERVEKIRQEDKATAQIKLEEMPEAE